jgi:hypothetical protein
MTLLMGVAACEGPPILELESIDEHAEQDYLNPPEVETGFEEPSPDAEGEIPLPLGFTEESWIEYLLEKVDEGFVVNYGGLDVVVATMDSPLVYEGPVPNVELVFLEQDEMDALGVEPGDPAPGSTALDARIYALAVDPSNIGSAVEGETTSKSWGDTPDLNPEGNFWTDEVGSSLAFARDSSITITGCTDMGDLSYTEAMVSWSFNSSLHKRRGKAKFFGSYTGKTRKIDILYPYWPCVCSWAPDEITTLYAKMFKFTIKVMINSIIYEHLYYFWFVSEPDVWVDVGEDGWDDIKLYGGKNACLYPHRLKRVVVEHNDKSITSSAVYSPAVDLKGGGDFHDLKWKIWNYKKSLVFNSGNVTVLAAVSDYAQAATSKYPVFPHDDPWLGYAVPITQGFTVPNIWCSEFTSWAFRRGAWDEGYLNYFDGIPEAESPLKEDIGVADFWNWANAPSKAMDVLVFGKDEKGNPEGIVNGPTPAEWSDLADLVKAGDYLGTREEVNTWTMATHSMVVVGWLKDDGTGVGSSNFDDSRPCNRLLVVDGNLGGVGLPGSKGLGSIVKVSTRVVCRQAEDVNGFSIEPDCGDIDGDGVNEQCEVRLWDTLSDGILPSKSSFFIDMEIF